jgi:hypothetical protein
MGCVKQVRSAMTFRLTAATLSLVIAAYITGVAPAAAASLPVVESIRIESSWGGLGVPRLTTYTILRRGDNYRRRFSQVPRNAVDRFLSAVTSPPVDRKTAIGSLVTPEWLATVSSEPHNGVPVPVCSPEAKRLLKQKLSDPEVAVRALGEYFSAGWTDDYPLISIDVTIHDGRTFHIESHHQPLLMLPWKVGNEETWNPEIPRAIVELLPSGAEPRLSDRNLANQYVEEVVNDASYELENPEERCVHHDFLQAVEKQFEVVRIYHGSPGSFTAYVRRADFPENLVLTLVIRNDAKPDAQAKLNLSVQRSGEYVTLAREFVKRFPERHFAIWCADGVSVEGIDGAIRISDYNTESGIVSNPRIILKDGSVSRDQ